MKKSILLFILWAVIAVVLTCVYLTLMMFQLNAEFEIIGWIIYLCTAVLTLTVMPIIRTQAKAEQITFTGDAPEFIDETASRGVTATAYYPADTPTWTQDKLHNYEGHLTWVPMK